MESSNLIAGMVSTLIAGGLVILTVFKTELIKSFVSKISGSKYSMLYIVIGILCAFVLSFFLTKYFVPTEENAPEVSSEKSEIEIYQDVAVESIDYLSDKVDDLKENKSIKDSIYEANREQQWVYQIGDIVSDENLLFDSYLLVDNIEGIHVFQTKKDKFFLFKDFDLDVMMMQDSLNVFRQKFDDASLKCNVVDLMTMCDRKEKILLVDELKIKQGKEKLFLPCYECGK